MKKYRVKRTPKKRRILDLETAMKSKHWPTVQAALADISRKYGLDYNMLVRQAITENHDLDPKRVSSTKEHFGIPQFGYAAMKDYGITKRQLRSDKPEDITASIDAMGRYMRDLTKRYEGDQILGAAAYNWGMGNVDSALKGKKHYPYETSEYMRLVRGGENVAPPIAPVRTTPIRVTPQTPTPKAVTAPVGRTAKDIELANRIDNKLRAQQARQAELDGEPTRSASIPPTVQKQPFQDRRRGAEWDLYDLAGSYVAPTPVDQPAPEPFRDTRRGANWDLYDLAGTYKTPPPQEKGFWRRYWDAQTGGEPLLNIDETKGVGKALRNFNTWLGGEAPEPTVPAGGNKPPIGAMWDWEQVLTGAPNDPLVRPEAEIVTASTPKKGNGKGKGKTTPRLRLPPETIFPGVENEGEMPFEPSPSFSMGDQPPWLPAPTIVQGGPRSAFDPTPDMEALPAPHYGMTPQEKGKYIDRGRRNTKPTSTSPKSLADMNKLGIKNFLGEIYALGDRPDFVPGQSYEPQLMQAYKISLQDRLNQSASTFRAAAQRVTQPEALSALAAQKYDADNTAMAEEFRMNQTIASDIHNQNISTVNQAALQNLQLADLQMQRQTQARANTDARKLAALTSIGDKYGQKQSENMAIRLQENLFDYRLNDKGELVRIGPGWKVNPNNIMNNSAYTSTKKKTSSTGDTEITETTPSADEIRQLIKEEVESQKGIVKRWGGTIKRMK